MGHVGRLLVLEIDASGDRESGVPAPNLYHCVRSGKLLQVVDRRWAEAHRVVDDLDVTNIEEAPDSSRKLGAVLVLDGRGMIKLVVGHGSGERDQAESPCLQGSIVVESPGILYSDRLEVALNVRLEQITRWTVPQSVRLNGLIQFKARQGAQLWEGKLQAPAHFGVSSLVCQAREERMSPLPWTFLPGVERPSWRISSNKQESIKQRFWTCALYL